MGFGFDFGGSKSKSKSSPWGVQIPYLKTGFETAEANLAAAQQSQYGNILGQYGSQLAPSIGQAQNFYSGVMSGGANPYTSDQYSSIVVDNRFLQDSYNTLDASFGLRKDTWSVELFGENLTDERAQLFINSLDTDLRITTNRPRTYGLKVRYDY